MRRIFTSVAPTVITLIAGLLVLASFILPLPALLALRNILIEIAVIVAGMALILGFTRLLSLHWGRFKQRRSGYSLVAFLAALITFGVLLADRILHWGVTSFVFNAVIVPVQSSLGALLAVILGTAALRMARRRRSWGAVWFLLSAMIVLITQVPASEGLWSVLQPIRNMLNAIALGGVRGLLLGVALGTLAVAVRVLLAVDRPQSE
jgi:hypothetical protein